MIDLGISILWCAMQVSIVSVVAIVLCFRPWRIGGVATPLFGLTSVIVISALTFVPIPGPITGVLWSWLSEPIAEAKSESDLVEDPGKSLLSSRESDEGGQHIDGEVETGPSEQDGRQDLVIADAPIVSFLELVRAGWDAARSLAVNAESQNGASYDDLHSIRNRLSMLVWGVFGIGFFTGIARIVLGLRGTSQLRRGSIAIQESVIDAQLSVIQARLSLKVRVEVRETSELNTAATFGVSRPLVLLPSHWRRWNSNELQAVLAHELAHVRHNDFSTHLLTQLGVILHFYNPLIHWLSGRLRLEQELAADATAASVAGGSRDYLQILAKLALEHDNQNVGWTARPFLPTKHTFLKRLEMLKNSEFRSRRTGIIGRLASLTVIGVTVLLVLAVRPIGSPVLAQSTTASVDEDFISAPYDFRYFSQDGGIVIAARPSDLLKVDKLAKIAELIQESPPLDRLQKSLGLELKDIAQVVLGFNGNNSLDIGPTALVLHTKKDLGDMAAFLGSGGSPSLLNGKRVYAIDGDLIFWQVDAKTIVLNQRRVISRMMQGRRVEQSDWESTSAWKAIGDRPFAMVVDGDLAREMFDSAIDAPSPVASMLSMISPIIEETEVVGIGVDTGDLLTLSANFECLDEQGAGSVKETLGAGIVLLKNGLKSIGRAMRSAADQGDGNGEVPLDFQRKMLDMGNVLLESSKVESDSNIATLTLTMDINTIPLEPFFEAVAASRQAAKRVQSANNLKQIGLAFHNFESVYSELPTSDGMVHRDNKRSFEYPYSWRVAILPFIEQNKLFEQYKFDEPWDSASNLKVLAQMPAIYRHPDAPAVSTNTSYVLLTGPETMFKPKSPAMFSEITDGLSNTIMVAEAVTEIPWTKPQDFEFDATSPLFSLGGYSPEGFNVVIGDGSVRFISKNIDKQVFRAMITAAGGEVIALP